ncbi:hypothetical protein BDV39DRAFT_58845 [Aspergillus sergii]|uniref:Uncharacterized protein n=1 Tax=Aspergillus sergii TaxID=1034303 RepID=A0A5N6X6N6_9EURO|nr:hypothetical protein BDV39DRAFT_58845 [Aspergillus sergii]
MQCDELIILFSAALSGLLKLESLKVCRKKGPHTDIHNCWKLNQGKRKEKIKSMMRPLAEWFVQLYLQCRVSTNTTAYQQ